MKMNDMNMFLWRFLNRLASAALFAAGLLTFLTLSDGVAAACSRVVYLGPEGMVVTGRTMDWKEDIRSNLFLFPRGIERRGSLDKNTLFWKAKYGSVIASTYEQLGTTDGMNEKGLAANLLFLVESDYVRPNDTRPVMNIGLWAQYVLDNFSTVREAVAELSKEKFRIDAPMLPNGRDSTVHLAISDATGNSAIFEYLDGNLVIHEGREYQVMTNSPTYDKQLALDDYWQEIGGTVMLPGTNRAADRFARGSFYVKAVTQTADPKLAAACVMSVMRNLSVPIGITTPGQPNISSTRWRTICDHKSLIYYFDSTLSPNTFWVEMKGMDFSTGAPTRRLGLTEGQIYAGNAASSFVKVPNVSFLDYQEEIQKQMDMGQKQP